MMIELKQEAQCETIQCFQCKLWKPMIQEDETPLMTYESSVLDKQTLGKILGVCSAFENFYPMFDNEQCEL
ncbi:hypothetical protein PP175_28705 (plasmid) [Aneurinibacillus sp. Ricciae_BoGa-3]|uniref:hypothetical protein n=1 Tax=Aneurinibacillus sp. Ricciae_BoGa-3 TaxID=3022697 RepID=UPI00233FC713|nr:hypothetical protein [Aneurinibacillus sp. Ricciae_BoGa-3]WCK57171.1 hypothetical protein PP175_28705 [Aneurinibacillus sp. Ricciae_BoGa-3]